MDDLIAMQTFVAAAEHGSFSAAARRLGTTQATVSRRVAELEQALGAPLVQRTTRRFALTEPGQRYLAAAREVLEAAVRARDVVREAEPAGLLRVAAPVSLTNVWLGPRLHRFLGRHPGIDLELDLSERHVDLVAEGFDAAVRVGGPASADLAGRRLRPGERWFVAAPSWVAAHGAPDTLDDLAPATGLIFAPTGTRPTGWSWPGARLTPARRVVSSNGQPLRELALAGHGVALLPDWLVSDAVAAGRLVRLLVGVGPPRLDLWVVWPQHRFARAATRAWVSWLVEESAAAGEPAPAALLP